jgi:hypothetical protein
MEHHFAALHAGVEELSGVFFGVDEHTIGAGIEFVILNQVYHAGAMQMIDVYGKKTGEKSILSDESPVGIQLHHSVLPAHHVGLSFVVVGQFQKPFFTVTGVVKCHVFLSNIINGVISPPKPPTALHVTV